MFRQPPPKDAHSHPSQQPAPVQIVASAGQQGSQTVQHGHLSQQPAPVQIIASAGAIQHGHPSPQPVAPIKIVPASQKPRAFLDVPPPSSRHEPAVQVSVSARPTTLLFFPPAPSPLANPFAPGLGSKVHAHNPKVHGHNPNDHRHDDTPRPM